MTAIQCPLCAWQYTPAVRWQCSPDGCGMAFDTFATGGKCPRCSAQFSITWCPVCRRPSPRNKWYAQQS
jgi:hypothetical protein